MIIPNKIKHTIFPYKKPYPLKNIYSERKIFKLDWNEATIPPSKKVTQEIKQFLRQKNHLNLYPDPLSRNLKKAIANYVDIHTDKILVTNGSYSAHELICRTYLQKNNEILVPIPTYSNFLNLPKIQGAKIIKVPYNVGEKCNIDYIINKISKKTKIIYLVNPYIYNYDLNSIRRIVNAAKKSLVIVDEAYHEFYGKSCKNLINKFNNLIVTRSFSKAFSLAGLRLGYILTNRHIINNLSKLYNFKSVNALAHIAGVCALRDLNYVKKYVREVNKSISILSKELTKLNFRVITTRAGFILFKHITIKKEILKHKLENMGIFVNDLGAFKQTRNYLRMNVGTSTQTNDLIKLIKQHFSS